MAVTIEDKLINNGTVEILKVHRDDDGWSYSGDGVAIKYDHKKAIEGVKYDIKEVKYDYGNDYETITNMYITNTYLLSLYKFIRKCEPTFRMFSSHCLQYGEDSYTDVSNPNRKVDRILPINQTNGFIFGIDLKKFISESSGVCSIENVHDGDYLIIMNGKRPIAKDPESFFNSGFEIVDKEIIIPNINFGISCINYRQFKEIFNVLRATGAYFDWDVPEFAKDAFWAAKAKYEKEQGTFPIRGKIINPFKGEKENEQNI